MCFNNQIFGIIVVASFLLSVILPSEPFSVSVPPFRNVCKNMVPGHSQYKPQVKESPFNVTTDIHKVQAGKPVQVTISVMRNEIVFRGFYIQARDEDGSPVGTFTPNDLVKTHSCSGIRSNAAHHANSDDKENLTVTWIAPKNWKGIVLFQATVVQRFSTFWTPLFSRSVAVMN